MDFGLGDLILERLRRRFSPSSREFIALFARREGDPFKVLVAVIISQNTNEKNSFKAYERLSSVVGLSPEEILKAGVEVVRGGYKAGRAAGH